MAEWSQRTETYIYNQVNGWLEEYFEENQQVQLEPKTPDESIAFYVNLFSESMYNYHLKTPKSWTATAAYDIVSWYFPTKVLLNEKEAKQVIPTLVSFTEFLGSKGYIRNAKTIVKALNEAKEEFFDVLQNPELFGTAKQFAMRAQEEGVDVSDYDQLREFAAYENFTNSQQENVLSDSVDMDVLLARQQKKIQNKITKLKKKKRRKK